MTNMKYIESTRTYRQGARAASTAATGQRIVDAFRRELREHWYDEITLDAIAAEAGVTVQTVLRRFGSKEALLEVVTQLFETEVRSRRDVTPGDTEGAIRAIALDYEADGDFIVRILAQEDRFTALRTAADLGRRHHRDWLAQVFAPWLAVLPTRERTQRLDALVIATDLYVWKLVRRDMRRPLSVYTSLMRQLLASALPEAVPMESGS
jgi:AcrR family transcriptional regulator